MAVENKTPETAYFTKDNIIDPSHTYSSSAAHQTKSDAEAAAGDARALAELASLHGGSAATVTGGGRRKGK